jgi:hypothetical protein
VSGIGQLDVDSKIDMNSIRIKKVKGDVATSGVQIKKTFDSSLEPKLQTPDDIMLKHHMQKERLSLPLVNYPLNNNSPRNSNVNNVDNTMETGVSSTPMIHIRTRKSPIENSKAN